jgi:hypothetical protein
MIIARQHIGTAVNPQSRQLSGQLTKLIPVTAWKPNIVCMTRVQRSVLPVLAMGSLDAPPPSSLKYSVAMFRCVVRCRRGQRV